MEISNYFWIEMVRKAGKNISINVVGLKSWCERGKMEGRKKEGRGCF